MKSLKRIFAIVLAVAMMFSMLSLIIFAAAEDYELSYNIKKAADDSVTINSAKKDTDVYVDVCITPGTYDRLDITLVADSSVEFTNEDVDIKVDGYEDRYIHATKKYQVNAQWSGPAVVPEDGVVMTIKVNVGTTVAEDVVILKNTSFTLSCYANGDYNLAPAKKNVTIDVLDAWIAATATVDPVANVAYGTAKDDIVLPAEAIIANAAGDKTTAAAVTDWDCADYDGNTAGTYTFTGKVAAGEYGAATVAEDIPVLVNVTVDKAVLTAEMIENDIVGKIKQGTTATGAQIVAALPAKADVADVEFDIAWTEPAEQDITVVGTEITVEGTVTGTGNYEGTVNVTGTVTVVPPTFDGAIAKVVDPINVVLGTADLTAALADVTAVVYDAEEAYSEDGYAITDWNFSAYNSSNRGTYTITGKVTSKGGCAQFTTLTATATVVVGPITLDADMVETALKGNIRKSDTYATPAYVVAALPSKATVKSGKITGEYAIAWTAPDDSVDVSVKGIEINVEGKIVCDGDFIGELNVAGTVEVFANIDGATVKVTDTKSTKPSVKVTIPAKEVAADEVITVVVTNEDDDELDIIEYTITEADMEAAGDGVVIVSFKGDTTFGDMGLGAGDAYKVVAYVGDIVLGAVDEDGKAIALVGTIKQTSSSGGSSSGGSSSGGSSSGGSYSTPETPADPVTSAKGFADVEGHWAAEAINTLVDKGIINGKSDTAFDPEGTVTRAEYTKMIVVALGLNTETAKAVFEDCAADAWFTPFVAAAAEAGIVAGVSDTEFGPDALITREQMATLLFRAVQYKNAEVAAGNTELAFGDATRISDYAKDAIIWAVGAGIINGNEDGTFAPAASATRAQAAKVIAGALNMLIAQ